MPSILDSLYSGYSGLNASQVAINTTSHNISNVSTPGYSRQRVITQASTPLNVTPGALGTGTQVAQIARVFDQFVFNSYASASQNKQYSDTLTKNLQTLSTYFPDINNIGIKNDMQNYFNAWQSFANNPGNNALKVSLAQQAQTMTQHITQTRDQITSMQNTLNDQLKSNIDEVNKVAQQIANLNKSIDLTEAGGSNNANDLRDQRNQLEMNLANLVGSTVTMSKVQTSTSIGNSTADSTGTYTIQIGGFNIVDGANFHPIGVDSTGNKNGYNDLYYQRQDGTKIPFAQNIKGGQVGAILQLRGSSIGTDGQFQDGLLQDTINNLDTFSKTLIESTNNIYAQSATSSMRSNPLGSSANQPLLNTNQTIAAGTFDLVAYDVNGNEVARRSVTIDQNTVLDSASATNLLADGVTPNSIVQQLSIQKDDNGDNNALNDINSIINPAFNSTQNVLQFDLNPTYASQGYTFAIEDKGTNFAGATGLSRFFDGTNAKTISLNNNMKNDNTIINAFKSPMAGDNQTALDMVQLQFSSLVFHNTSGLTNNDTLYGYYDTLATKVGTAANAAKTNNDTLTAQYNTVKQQYDSISAVNIDEEMANLIRYQTSYGAAAKVITTIDQMMTTLLGIKA
ncbi:MAG: flagellar hook-associated protein FlgK [Sulfuricurvum sp.]|nr:flagellar hook-associated protein FlgK [Sulfuricurvum sp.]